MKVNCRKTIFIVFLVSFFTICFVKDINVKASELYTKYNMNLEFNEKQKCLYGKEEVYIKNSNDDDLKSLVFHLYADSYNEKDTMPASDNIDKDKPLSKDERGDICIENVLVNGQIVKFTQNNQILKIWLDKELKKGESLKVLIQFNLKLPNGFSRLGYSDDVYCFANWYPVLSMYDSNSSKWNENVFYPIGESNYSEIGDYDVNIKVPKSFVVVSTGKEKEVLVNEENKIVNLKAKDVRDFSIMMSPYFKSLSEYIDGIKINSYYIEKNNMTNETTAKNILNTSVNAVKFFNCNFGKYPYEELDIIETCYEGGAMEYPQLIQMPRYSSENIFIEETAVHEVAHQWWYVAVGNDEFNEPFLDESLTSFSTAYYFEKALGEYSRDAVIRSLRYKFTIAYENGMKNINFPSCGSSVDKFENDFLYNMALYKTGALIFEDLRRMVGESRFLEILQAYFKEYKFANASIKDLLNVIEKKCGKSIKKYIENSIYSDSYMPEHLKVTSEELKKIKAEELKEKN